MIENERRKKLEETMKMFNKKHKTAILDFGKNTEDLEVVPVGIKPIDDFLGGGTKRGTYTIFWGGYSVGKTSLVLQQIAHVQKEGKICCYVNLEKPIDQKRFQQFGVNLDELVLANHTEDAEQALEIVRTLCKEKIVDLVVIDSLNAMAPKAELVTKKGKERDLDEKNIAELARTMSEFCRKVNPDIYRSKASVIVIGQTRVGGIGTFFTRATLSGGEAIKFYAYNMVFMRRGQGADAPKRDVKRVFIDPEDKIRSKTVHEDVGFDVVMRMDKTNACESARENQTMHIPYYYDTGFIKPPEHTVEIVNAFKNEEEKQRIEEFITKKGWNEKKEEISNKDFKVAECEDPKETVKEVPKARRGRPKKDLTKEE